MTGFGKFFNRGGEKVQKYVELCEGENTTEEEKREFEQNLMVPDELPPYGGASPTADAMEDLTVRLVFPDEESAAQFKRHFKVSSYVEKSVHELGLLTAMLDALEEKRLTYDKNTGRISVQETLQFKRGRR